MARTDKDAPYKVKADREGVVDHSFCRAHNVRVRYLNQDFTAVFYSDEVDLIASFEDGLKNFGIRFSKRESIGKLVIDTRGEGLRQFGRSFSARPEIEAFCSEHVDRARVSVEKNPSANIHKFDRVTDRFYSMIGVENPFPGPVASKKDNLFTIFEVEATRFATDDECDCKPHISFYRSQCSCCRDYSSEVPRSRTHQDLRKAVKYANAGEDLDYL